VAPIPKSILAWLWRVWRDKYGMGRIDLSAKVYDREKGCYIVPKSAWSAIYYATKYMSKSVPNYGEKKVFSASPGALGSNDGGSIDNGVPLFAAYADEFTRSNNLSWGPDSREVFRSKFRDELEQYRASLEGSFQCRVSPDRLEELKKRFPGAILPGRFRRKQSAGPRPPSELPRE